MGNNSALFTGIAANWDNVISNGVTQTINNSLSANAAVFAGTLTIYIVIMGFLTAFHRLSAAEAMGGVAKAGFISFLLVAANFASWVQQPLMTDIPNWIAQAASGQYSAQSAPQQFDALRNGVVAIEANILQQATGWTEIGERIRAGIATACICLELTVSFMIWEGIRGLIGLLVATIPFVMALFLFQPTKHVPLNVLGNIGAALLLLMLMSILLNITINADQIWLNQSRGVGADLDIQLDNMLNIGLFFLFGMSMSVFLPILAGRICHGVLPGTSAPTQGLLKVAEKASSDGGDSKGGGSQGGRSK